MTTEHENLLQRMKQAWPDEAKYRISLEHNDQEVCWFISISSPLIDDDLCGWGATPDEAFAMTLSRAANRPTREQAKAAKVKALEEQLSALLGEPTKAKEVVA